MKSFRACVFFLSGIFFAGLLGAQTDSTLAIQRVFPEKGEAYEPVFSPFCPNRCWLNEHEFDLGAGRFVPADSCICRPAETIRYDFDLVATAYKGEPLRWEQDPYSPRYCWTYDYHRDRTSAWEEARDTLYVCRYDRNTWRQSEFRTLTQAQLLIGRTAIWVYNQDELVMYEKSTGKVLRRIKNPLQQQLILSLKNWGEDVLLSERMLYRVAKDQMEPFFAIPADMEGCAAPEKLHFFDDACIAEVRNARYASEYYCYAPGRAAVKIPLEPLPHEPFYLVDASPERVWLLRKDTLWAVDPETLLLNAYPIPAEDLLNGRQNGRFLGFACEKGLIFFDKMQCRYKVVPMPYQYERPYSFYTVGEKLLLKYRDHWEVVLFSALSDSFNATTLQEQYLAFEPEIKRFYALPEDFYSRYHFYITLKAKYEPWNNPKIGQQFDYFKNNLSYALYIAPDTIIMQVQAEFDTGKIDSSLTCVVAENLIRHYAFKGILEGAGALIRNYPDCMEYIAYHDNMPLDQVTYTLYRLDSIAAIYMPDDEKLYATGKIWLDYSPYKTGFHYSFPQDNAQQAFAYFRKLLKEYPKSVWADNAAYDTMQYIDYRHQDSSDDAPEGDAQQAYLAFKQFLADYPDSERRPDALLRLAAVMMQREYYGANMEEAKACFDTLMRQYPAFIAHNEEFRKWHGVLLRREWNDRWNVYLYFEQDTIAPGDSVVLCVRLENRSAESQPLSASYLDQLDEGAVLHIYRRPEKGCQEMSGDFRLWPFSQKNHEVSIIVPPGKSYTERFTMLFPFAFDPGLTSHFYLMRGSIYECSLSINTAAFSIWDETSRAMLHVR